MNMNIYINNNSYILSFFIHNANFCKQKENKRMERKGKEKQNRISRKNVFLYNVYD